MPRKREPKNHRRPKGMGSIVTRGKGAEKQTYLRLRYRDENGKWREKFERVFSVTGANQKAVALQHELKSDGERLFDGDRMTFRELASLQRDAPD